MSTLRLWQNLWNQWFFKIPVLGPLFRKLNLFFKSKPRLGYFIGCLITFHFVALAWLPFWGGHPQGTLAMLRLLGIAKDPEAWMLLLKKFDW
ncbi:MAG: hypothetical protein JNK65_01715 [Deltaproteobacteria bacterium]|nr:hypothetical protein [Deltaproteobacteria bacterium]